jgi:hypothetical protein
MADLGSAILQGMQSVQDSAARRQQMRLSRDELALSQQRTDLDRQRTESALAVDKARLREADDARNKLLREDARTSLYTSGDRIIGAGLRDNFFNFADEQRPLNGAAVISALGDADPLKRATAERFMLDMLNQERRKRRFDSGDYSADDFEFVSLDPEALKQGQIVARGSYKDGRPGVATVDGSADPSSQILSLSFDEAANHMELFARVGVLPFSNMGGTDASTRAVVVNRAVGGVGSPPRTQAPSQTPVQAVNSLLPQIDSAATEKLGASGVRDVRSLLVEAQKNPAEFNKRVVQIAQQLGIDIPSVLKTRPNDGRRNAGDELNLVEPDKYVPPLESAANPVSLMGAAQMNMGAAVAQLSPTFRSLGSGAATSAAPRNNPLTAIETKIAQKKKAAKNLTGDAAIKAETEIAKMEGQRHQLVTNINVRQFQGINSEIENLSRARAGVATERRGEFDKKISQLKGRREAYIASGFATPAMRTEAFQELTTNVLSRLDAAKPEDVARLVDSGALKFPPRQVAAMTARAREVGVKSVADIAKLPNKSERNTFFAMMYAWAEDSNERNQIVTAMRNITETGIMSMSRDDMIKAQQENVRISIAQGTLEVNRGQLRLAEAAQRQKEADEKIASGENVPGFLKKSREDFNNFLFTGAALPKEDQGFQSAPDKARISSAALLVTTPLLQAAQRAEAQGQDATLFYQEINTQISAVIAGLGNVNNTGWLTKKPLTFMGDPLFANRDSSVTTSDSNLGRIKAVYSPGRNGEQYISGFQYMNANGQDTGATVTVSQLNNIDPSIAPLAKAVVDYRERASEREANTSVGIPASGLQDPRLRE